MNVWERVRGWFSPSSDHKRAAHAAAAKLLRNYEAASHGRRTSGWARSHGDVDSIIARAGPELRLHARNLLRNNGYARRAQATVVNNTVGWGIVARAKQPNAQRDAAWLEWAEDTRAEAEGRHTFAGLQAQVMRSLFSDGEVLARRRWRKPSDGLALPFQVQLLEIDYLDSNKESKVSLAGGPIIQGVEFDKIGRRAAYWLFDSHPGSSILSGTSKRIPASEILHVFASERPEQTRGVSWLACAILNLNDLDEFEDAELMKQKIAACFAGFVTDTDGSAAPIGEPSTEAGEELVEEFEPGMIEHLPPGKNITFANPPALSNDGLAVRTLRRVAAGLGVTYEDLTGDYSQVNFSSARMARLAHWGYVADWQYNLLIPQFCAGVWRWAMEAASLTGAESSGGADWSTPPMPMIEPDKEGLALQRLVRTGALTPSQMVRQQGGDPKAHWIEYAADLKQLDELKIKLDSDVRAVSQAGLTQERGAGGSAGGAPQPQSEKPPVSEDDRDLEVDVSVEELES